MTALVETKTKIHNVPVQTFSLSDEQVKIIKEMYGKDLDEAEWSVFIHICQHTGLNPMLKQIYPVKRFDGKLRKLVMTIQTGIDGFRLIAERTGKYAPGRAPTFEYDNTGKLISATAYVKKQTQDGTWHEFSATAFYDEYVQKDKEGNPTKFWQVMGRNQLSKCAESLCLRKGFPQLYSQVYTHEEMQQAYVEEIEKKEPTPEEIEESILKYFEGYDKAEAAQYLLYLKAYQTHHKKNMVETLKDYEDKEKLKSHYQKWMAKKNNQ